MARTPQQVAFSVKRLQMQHHRALDERLGALDISLVQWDALRRLSENPDASLHDLAQLTFQTDQSFGALAGRLIQRGLIERVPGPGRAARHRLTPRGLELHRAGEAIVAEVVADSLSPLTAEQLATFDDLLAKLIR